MADSRPTKRGSAGRRSSVAVGGAASIITRSHDCALRVERKDRCPRGVGYVNREGVYAAVEDEAVLVTGGIQLESHNHARVVDPLGNGEGRAGHIQDRVDTLAQQETVAVAIRLVNVVPY